MIKITAIDMIAKETTTLEAKSISGAWNEIRKIRNSFNDEPTKGEGIILKIDMGDAPASNRLPLEIIFTANKNGKLEFKDLQKIREKTAERNNKEREAKEAKAKEVKNVYEMKADNEPLNEQNESMGEDLAISML
jgi:hypothetical protein